MIKFPFRIDGTFLRSKVARRVFLLFVLSAFVPAALLTVFSYGHLRSVDNDHLRRQLASEGGQFARGVYERLLNAHFLLGMKKEGLRAGLRVPDPKPFDARQVFRRLFLVSGQTIQSVSGPPPTAPLPVLDEQQLAHLAKGESALMHQGRDPDAATVLVMARDPAQPASGWLVGELEPVYMWGDKDDLSDQSETCVVSAGRVVLFCSDDRFRGQAVAEARQGEAITDESGRQWVRDARGLFLRARFMADDWSVVTFRQPTSGLGGLRQLTQGYLGVIVLALLLVAYLSVVQIRRTMVPLERLIEGTRRIADEKFDQPVDVARNDEFGELAQAFNAMAGRLGQQIGTLRVLSQIDHEILSRVDMVQVIARVQERLREIWPDAVTSVVVFDQSAADFGIVHLDSGRDGMTLKLPTRLEPWLLTRLAHDYDGAWFDVGGSELPDFLSMLASAGAKRILVLPIFWQEKVNGMLAIGLPQSQEFGAERTEQARDLGNRIGVALAAHARDEQLKYRAYHDSLTGLPNRSLLIERMNQEMAHARRQSKQLAVLFLDLDRFKNVNDTKGHESGDRMLCQVADRLTSCTREIDTVARLGGDEFVVLLPGITSPQQAARLAEEMLSLLQEPFMIDGTESYIGVSIGVAVFPADGALAPELLKKADMAMYRAKALGRGRILFFEESMNVAQQERGQLERELRAALSRRQLSLQYQPRVRLSDGQMCGAEVLLRWRHPELGWVSPAKFIPVAEEIGLIDEIGEWVLHQACGQLATWQSRGLGIDVVSINVSGQQLKSGKLPRQVRSALEFTGVRPEAIELEVTEGTLIDNIEEVTSQLGLLKETGVTIALDDFGTGYSSLTYLQCLPLDVLKIDQTFINELGDDEDANSIVYSIITLAHALRKVVVAEGVESVRQIDMLRTWGCEQIQGYYYSRPLTVDEMEEIMGHSRPAPLH